MPAIPKKVTEFSAVPQLLRPFDAFKILAVLSLSFFISGCAWVTYSPYAGQQQDWPTAKGSFVTQKDGILIYRGLPDRPYHLVGEVVIDQYPQYMNGAIAHAAHVRKADAAMIVNKEAMSTGMMTYGGGSTTRYESQSTSRTTVNAYPSGNSFVGNAISSGLQYGTATTIANPTYSGQISWDRTTVYLINFIKK